MLAFGRILVSLYAIATMAQAPVVVAPGGRLPPGLLTWRCVPVAEARDLALADLKAAPVSDAQQQVDIAAGAAAIARATDLRTRVLAGEAVEAPYLQAGRFAKLGSGASTPSVAELFRRTAQDQYMRAHMTAASQRLSWAQGLSDNARAYALKVIMAVDCDVDQVNTAWLKAVLAQQGWFTISAFGRDADVAAFLLVQHADQDRAFQSQVLRMLEPLAVSGDTSPRSYAYLYDRIAVGNGKPQRFGTQGRCKGPGRWEPEETEAPAGLDERRASVGLEPEANYKAGFVKLCP